MAPWHDAGLFLLGGVSANSEIARSSSSRARPSRERMVECGTAMIWAISAAQESFH